jgi:cbb3-type cytochrome oxidase subunit 3
MEFYELDAMFTFTVGMGFTAFIMSLVILNIAIKAWAVKREQRSQLNESFRFP